MMIFAIVYLLVFPDKQTHRILTTALRNSSQHTTVGQIISVQVLSRILRIEKINAL